MTNSISTLPKRRISHSQVNTYLSCAAKWDFQYQQGIRVRTTDIAPATLGDAVHLGISSALRKVWEWRKEFYPISYDHVRTAVNDAVDGWSEVNRPEGKTSIAVNGAELSVVDDADFYSDWDDMVANAKSLAHRTLMHIELLERYDVVELDGEPLIEYAITAEIPDTNFEFAGKIDAVLRNRITGLTEVVDWKVRGKFTGIESEQLNNQIGLYQYALQQKGIHAQVGVVYQIRNEAPKKPSQNKDGSMSRRRIISTWEVYREALVEAGLDPADYEAEMQPKLADIEFFRPLIVIRSEKVTSALWNNMVAQAKRIEAATDFPKSYGYPCRNCPFAELCNAQLYGYDTEELFETRYEVRSYAAENEESEVTEGESVG